MWQASRLRVGMRHYFWRKGCPLIEIWRKNYILMYRSLYKWLIRVVQHTQHAIKLPLWSKNLNIQHGFKYLLQLVTLEQLGWKFLPYLARFSLLTYCELFSSARKERPNHRVLGILCASRFPFYKTDRHSQIESPTMEHPVSAISIQNLSIESFPFFPSQIFTQFTCLFGSNCKYDFTSTFYLIEWACCIVFIPKWGRIWQHKIE